jgi:hypothetical protein
MRPKIYFILNGKRVVVENLKLDEKTFDENKSKILID